MTDAIDALRRGLGERYAIERELGAGGMATVYLARDLRHDRDVAIKVLHPDLGAALGGERFLAEIRTTARLQHPHILPLLDSGVAEHLLYYVMPYVAGETLRTRLERERQLPVADALLITREVADALGAAHALGIIHRDIKPENILLQGGHALVADFGIALAVQSAGGQRMTQTGLSLGTPQYMSPEQAMGEKTVDARSDIYALGAVTYEMLAGEPPFTGPSVQAIVARIMTEQPRALGVQRRSIPGHVEAAVLQALEKLPADRFATAAEFANSLAQAGTATTHAGARATGDVARGADGRWKWAALGLGTAAVAFAALAARGVRPRSSSAGPQVYDAALPDSAPMTFAGSAESYGTPLRNLSISPAGDVAVYVAKQGDSTMLWQRSLVDASAHDIPGTGGAVSPRISPDGSRIAFFSGNALRVIPMAGGAARRVMEIRGQSTLFWTSPTEVLAMSNTGATANLVDVDVGQPRVQQTWGCVYGQRLADGRHLLCGGNGNALVMEPDSGTTEMVRTTRPDGTPGPPFVGSSFRLVDDRYLVYVSVDGDLRAAPYDAKRMLVGRPVSVQAGVRREPVGDAQFDLSPDGTLLFAGGANAEIGRIARLGPSGAATPLPIEAAAFQRVDLSRDGRWLAAAVQTLDGQELRAYDLRTGQKVTVLRAETIRHPVWLPSGERLLTAARNANHWVLLSAAPFAGSRLDTLARDIDGVHSFVYSATEPTDAPGEHDVIAQDWVNGVVTHFDPAGRPLRFDTVATNARFASVSPDGRHLLYQTIDDNKIRITPYPAGAGRQWQVATNGVEPLWLSSTEVLYRLGGSWYVVKVNAATGEPTGAAAPWNRDARFSDTRGWSNRLSHDGGILFMQGPEQTVGTYLRVVPGWVARMKAAVDAANK